jgi:uncharacterized membrane protein YhdT
MQILLIIPYVLLSYLVGLTGRNKKFGFYGYFFLSIFLTPLVGVIIVLASNYKIVRKSKNE